MTKTQADQQAAVIKKTRLSVSQIVAPLPGNRNPLSDRPGLYPRISAKTGAVVWAYWNGKQWGLYADSKERAMQRKHKRSKKQLPWFGFHAAASTARAR